MASPIIGVDTVGIPSQDAERARSFYFETLELRQDENARYEFWVGETCFAIWEPARTGMEFAPVKNGLALLHVEDVAAARTELEGKGVEFLGETFDTGVCNMATFLDPDRNQLVLHKRYAPYGDGSGG